jgi:signal transduction histidine kinase
MVLMATVRALLRLRNAEFNSRKAAEHWQTTFDSLAEGVALVDDKGCVARWNGSFRSMCGSKADLDEGEDAARLLERLIGTSDPLRQNTALFRGEFECGRKTIQLAVSRVSGDGAQEKVLTLTDVTDRKLAEYAIRTAEKLAATGRLANAIAHEINNPLEALTNLVYLARSTAPLESVYALLDSASRELDRVARITKQSLAFHRDTHIPVEIDLGSLLADVIGMVERSATSHRVRIVLQQQSAEKAFGYPGQLNQVFSNLLRNATEAAPAGSEVIVRLKAIERTGRRGNRITIHDRGSGIPLEIQSSVFDPFFTTKALRGSGLGLWVSKSLVAKHDGTIRFRSCSHAGRSGTSFEVFLPATDPWYLSE